MANMSYCRFENTASDMQECVDALYEFCEGAEAPTARRSHGQVSVTDFKEQLSSDYEKRAFDRLLDLARDLIATVEEMEA